MRTKRTKEFKVGRASAPCLKLLPTPSKWITFCDMISSAQSLPSRFRGLVAFAMNLKRPPATSRSPLSFIGCFFWSLGGFRRIAAPSGQIDRQDGPQASHRFGLCRTSVDCTCFDQPCLDWPWIAHMESAFLLWFEEKKRRTMHTLFWMLSEVGGKVS